MMRYMISVVLFCVTMILSGCGKDESSFGWDIAAYEGMEDIIYIKEIEVESSKSTETYEIRYYSDQCEIISYLSIPQQCLSQKIPFPCMIYNRGGNRNFGVTNPETNAGYAEILNMIVFSSQYRGAAGGTGQDEFGGDDVHDVINLIDLCEQFAFVDMNRIYMMGISRGGMMTYRAVSEDDRINKAVVVSGVADAFMNYEERPDIQDVYQILVGGSPEELPLEYERRSATYWADKLRCPILVIHSKLDDKVSYAQAEKMVQKMEEAGAEYEFITYEDDTHGFHKEDLEHIKNWLR